MRFLVWGSWEYRKPHLWAGVRFGCAVWNLALGVLLLSYSYWVGAVPLAGAVLLFWTSYRLQQCVLGGPAASVAG
jgi:hypothetical protein